MINMKPLTALKPQDAAKAEAILKRLIQEVDQQDKLWGAKPYLYVGEVCFKRRKKKPPVLVLNVYFVLGDLYSHDNYYQAIPAEDHPGHYEFKHKTVHYRISSSNYRKTVNKRLVPMLRSLAETENHQSKIALKTDATSGLIEMKYRAPDTTAINFRFIPAMAGTSLPQGVNPNLPSLVETQPTWFLVAPEEPTANGTWELDFPTICEDVLGSSKMSQVLITSWLAIQDDWVLGGLQNPSKAIKSLALEMKQSQKDSKRLQSTVRTGTEYLLQNLANVVCQSDSSLRDFCVPTREYLKQNNEEQRTLLVTEMEKALGKVKSPDEWQPLETCYPGLLPEEAIVSHDDVDQPNIPDEELSDIMSTTESNVGESTGGDTEGDTPPTSPPRTRQLHIDSTKRRLSKAQRVSSSDSDVEEPCVRAVNNTSKYSSSNGTAKILSPITIPARHGRSGVKIMGITLLVILVLAVITLLIAIFWGEYDWMLELERAYEAIINTYENVTGAFDAKAILSPAQNEL